MSTPEHGAVPRSIPATRVTDERGWLSHFRGFNFAPYIRSYIVFGATVGATRGWHRSNTQHKAFLPTVGRALVSAFFVQDPFVLPNDPEIHRFELDGDNPVLVVVPAGWVHAVRFESDGAAVLVFASLMTEDAASDEQRFPISTWDAHAGAA